MRIIIGLALVALLTGTAAAQVPPSPAEVAAFGPLHAAAHAGDAARIGQLLAQGEKPDQRDGRGRTPLHVAVFARRGDAARALVAGGADPRAQEHQRYDTVTIAAVANDPETMSLALALGADPKAVTSPYDGTALIAAAHLGHDEVVRRLLRAGAPVDHVNNLGWTALIEAVVLGDGGPRHQACVRALVEAGADPRIGDRNGVTPLTHAERRGYTEIAALIRAAPGR